MNYSKRDIVQSARQSLKASWTVRNGIKVPENADLKLDNDAVALEGAVLYADMKQSTAMVRDTSAELAAKYYKIFLSAACDVIRNNNGTITSFDGDRVMAVYIGNRKCSDAGRTALQLHAVIREINTMIESELMTPFKLQYAVGIDISELFVVRTGIRGSNYLAWIGEAANNAAKLSEIRTITGPSFITKRVFNRLNDNSKFKDAALKTDIMWQGTNVIIEGQRVFESGYWWNFD